MIQSVSIGGEFMERIVLISLRKEANLTQSEVAEKAGINRSFYGFIEKGIRNPTLRKAERIANVFGKTVSEVFPNDIFFAGKCYITEQNTIQVS